jgi:tetratricopeptide (TPR) repeat protein
MMALLGMSLENLIGGLIVLLALGIYSTRCLLQSDDRRNLVIKWICSVVFILIGGLLLRLHSVVLTLLYILPAIGIGFLWLPNIGSYLLKPLTDSFDGGADESEMKPFYFRAEAKRRKGLYQEAAAEVRRQLEQFPGDVEGMMKLAEIQAQDLRDLPAATETLNELLEQPGLPHSRTIAALQTLADWQMNLGRDAAAARRSFERIIQLFPDSPASLTAEQRIAHLDGVSQAREFREHAVFKVPVRERGLGLRPTVRPESRPEDEAAALAEEYVRQLQQHPNDTETREKLALLYGEQLDRLDLAVDQLEQLAALTKATPKQTAHWLELLATLHIRQGNDMAAAEHALRRIIDRFPQTAVASRAVARIATLQGELKAAATVTAAKALGSYEKDIGLKSGPASSFRS